MRTCHNTDRDPTREIFENSEAAEKHHLLELMFQNLQLKAESLSKKPPMRVLFLEPVGRIQDF
jgi:hypothetical protein